VSVDLRVVVAGASTRNVIPTPSTTRRELRPEEDAGFLPRRDGSDQPLVMATLRNLVVGVLYWAGRPRRLRHHARDPAPSSTLGITLDASDETDIT
jgi:hypothetical protein